MPKILPEAVLSEKEAFQDGSYTCFILQGGETHALKFFLKRVLSEKEAFLDGSYTCFIVQGGETHALKISHK